MSKRSFATVALVIDNFRIVINRGSFNGINENDRFLIYELTEDIIDPENGFNLGPLELSKGTGIAIDVQEKLTIIESDMFKRPLKVLSSGIEPQIEEGLQLPFANPKVNDKAKLI